MESTKRTVTKVKVPIRSARSTPRKPVTSSTPAAAGVYTVTVQRSRTVVPTPNGTRRFRSGSLRGAATPNSNSVPVPAPSPTLQIQWFQPITNVEPGEENGSAETFNPLIDIDDIEDTESPPPIPEIIEAEIANDVIDEPEKPEPFPWEEPEQTETEYQHHGSAQDLGPVTDSECDPDLTSASETSLSTTTNRPRSTDSELDPDLTSASETRLSTVIATPRSTVRSPSTSNIGAAPGHKSKGSRRSSFPGRYKVKVLEQGSGTGGKKKGPKAMDPNSPYCIEDFIDIDGKLKLSGKSFETYVTHQQYQLLKDFYIPGIVATRISHRRSKPSLFTIPSRSSINSTSSKSKSPRSPSPAIPSTSQSGQVRQVNRNLQRTQTDSEVQTIPGHFSDQESQTRSTVDFDLERTTVKDYERDPDDDPDDGSSQAGILSHLHNHNFTTEITEGPVEEAFWEDKINTAVQMVSAILSAQTAGKASLESETVLEALRLLGSEQVQEVMASMTEIPDIDEPKGPRQGLIQLMDAYSVAYGNILNHLRAAEAYEEHFPESLGHPVTSNKEQVDLDDNLLGIDSTDSVGDTGQVKVASEELVEAKETDILTKYLDDHPTFLRYCPEITPGQLKFQLGATPDHLFQEIHLHSMTLRMTYSINGVSTVVSATRGKDGTVPISSGNLLLMHSQHVSLLGSRLITSKYFFNRVILQLLTLSELFLVGKYAVLSRASKKTVSPSKYQQLRQISVFTSILFPLCHSFVHATRKIQTSLRDLVRPQAFTRTASLLMIGQSQPAHGDSPEVTVPLSGVLQAPSAYSGLLTALTDIDSIINSGSKALQSLTCTEGVKVSAKYFRTLVSCLDGVRQLERGRELDFGALLIGYTLDLTLLEQLDPTRESVGSKQKCHLFKNYQEIQTLLQDLSKLSRKTTLICSYVASRSMKHLHKFRYAQGRPGGCWGLILRPFQRRRPSNRERLEALSEKQAVEDLRLEKNALEEDRTRLVQMLRNISKESAISFSIF